MACTPFFVTSPGARKDIVPMRLKSLPSASLANILSPSIFMGGIIPHMRSAAQAPIRRPRGPHANLVYYAPAMKHTPAIVLMCAAVALQAVQALGMEVWFLRHGETTWNRAKVLQGSIPYTTLTRKGVREAEETARGMHDAGVRFDRIYTSPYRRARQTAEIISRGVAGPEPAADPRIREMCFGKYEGMRYAKGEYPDENMRFLVEEPERYVPSGDGAEALADVGARIRKFLEDEIRPLEGSAERVLCVSHSLVLRALVGEIAGGNAPASARKPIQPNCCVHVLKCEGGRFSLAETCRLFYSPEAFDSTAEPKMVAHRGAGDLTMPEASLPAYSNAVAMGCNVVKLDVQRTKDGVVVMGHDATLKRNMGWGVRIPDTDYAEILGKGRFLEDGRRGRWRIVRLDEALAIVKPIPEMWIDFKDDKSFTPEFAEQVVSALDEAGIDLCRVMVASFNRRALKYFQERHPSVRRVGHFSFRDAGDGNRKALAQALRFKDEYGLYGLNMPVNQRQTRPEDIAFLKGKGLWISLWFVQNAETAAYYRPSAPDAFVTDHVSLVRE